MPETFELSELIKYVLEVVTKYQRPLVVPAELGTLVDTINDALDTLLSSGYEDADDLSKHVPKDLFKYWGKCWTTYTIAGYNDVVFSYNTIDSTVSIIYYRHCRHSS